MNWLGKILAFFNKISVKNGQKSPKSGKEYVKIRKKTAKNGVKIHKKVDWKNPKSKISKYFTVHEALWLPSWGMHHIPNAAEKREILKTAKKMDVIRKFIRVPIKVNVWMRPQKANCPGSKWHGKSYNRYVYEKYVWAKKRLTKDQMKKKRAPNSAHKYGKAVDWVPKRLTIAKVRKKLIPKLSVWKIRVEDIKGNWIHVDTNPPGRSGKRFFKP